MCVGGGGDEVDRLGDIGGWGAGGGDEGGLKTSSRLVTSTGKELISADVFSCRIFLLTF